MPQSAAKGDLFLEEFRFKAEQVDLKAVLEVLSQFMPEDESQSLEKQLAIVNDDMFAHISRFATPVNAHIRINNETKIVQKGALWYEETLPPQTVLYTTLMMTGSRNPNEDKNANALMDFVLNRYADRPYLQIGGNETVGMGWCCVRAVKGEA